MVLVWFSDSVTLLFSAVYSYQLYITNTAISVVTSFAFHKQLQTTLHNPHFYFISMSKITISSAEMVAVHVR